MLQFPRGLKNYYISIIWVLIKTHIPIQRSHSMPNESESPGVRSEN